MIIDFKKYKENGEIRDISVKKVPDLNTLALDFDYITIVVDDLNGNMYATKYITDEKIADYLTLGDIIQMGMKMAKKQTILMTVIAENGRNGIVLRYGNRPNGSWELVGETCGYL